MDWLNSKDKGSVIYIAFASYSEISSQLIEVFGHGLLECGRPFLWVIREGQDGEKMEEKLSCKDELEKQGKIMSWCSQMKVLKHPSIDIWKSGVRVNVSEGGVVEKDDFNRCITIVMGDGE
ncbi:hypothetical protein KY289_001629 [Solanum tuberosum]|nr:hypothetical protein KY289_001629 [Solanum tuberosum]